MKRDFIISPKSGRKILVDGAAYNDLLDSKYRQKALRAKKFKEEYSKSSTKAHGCTNAMRNKYPDVKSSDFCGSAGGSCARSYPVNTPGRARAALAYARFAPNPKGIKSCVYRKSEEKGWMKDGKLRVK